MQIKKGYVTEYNKYKKSLISNSTFGYGIIEYVNSWTKLLENHKGQLDGKSIYEYSINASNDITESMFKKAKEIIRKYHTKGEHWMFQLDDYEKELANTNYGRII